MLGRIMLVCEHMWRGWMEAWEAPHEDRQTALLLPLRGSCPARSDHAHLTFILREWICMILARASSLGIGNSIFRSRRPERSKAGSKMSTLLVAAIT